MYRFALLGNPCVCVIIRRHDFYHCVHCVCMYVFCVQWEQVEYFDNKIICDLVEEKHQGILAVLVS